MVMPSKEPYAERFMRTLIHAAVVAVISVFLSVPVMGTHVHVVGVDAPKKVAPEDFSQTLSKATLEMYVGKQECKYHTEDSFFGPIDVWGCKFVAKPICTATIVKRDDELYYGVSAGHCVDPELYIKGYQYYVSDVVADNPVLDKIQILKWNNSDRYDYLAFSFRSLRERPVIEMAGPDEDIPAIGTEVINANFSLGVIKQVTEGKVVSGKITPDTEHNKGVVGRYFVSVGIGPGASGSAIVDKKTHKIVGLVEAVYPSTQMPTIIIPMGKKFYDFMDDDSVVEPVLPPGGVDVKYHDENPSANTVSVMGLIKKYIWQQLKELGF
jgi:hypothetical protein